MTQRAGSAPPRAAGASSHRLFFALWPDDDTRARIAEAAEALKRRYRPDGRWIDAHRYHLTLRFLGSFDALPEALVDAATRAGESLRSPPFVLRIDRAGSFRNRAIPWWLGCRDVPAVLVRLHAALETALSCAGIALRPEPTFVPHVTILRDASAALAPTDIAAIEWPIHQVMLVHRVVGGASRYVPLARWTLRDDIDPEDAERNRIDSKQE